MPNRKKAMLTKDAPLSSHLAVYICKLGNLFLLDLASIKTLLAGSIFFFFGGGGGGGGLGGCERQIFLTKNESMKSATAFLPMSSASIRSLAMPGLAGTPKDKSTVHCL